MEIKGSSDIFEKAISNVVQIPYKHLVRSHSYLKKPLGNAKKQRIAKYREALMRIIEIPGIFVNPIENVCDNCKIQ